MLPDIDGFTSFSVQEYYDSQTGHLRLRLVHLNGKRHAPPDGSPSHAAYDELGRPLYFVWHQDDLEHRESGPSSIRFNPENGVHVFEAFMKGDVPDYNSNGQYVIYRDPETGKITGPPGTDDQQEGLNGDRKSPGEPSLDLP